ncbi:MAG: PspC domain-containing protein [Proteobacteria bacterium]|nr:PspC domain-containing protein [Pseudomonadota bacterium]
MRVMDATSERRFYRDADRALLGGVCAGLAGYLGFNLKMTRCLAFIAFLMAMPIAVIGYLAVVFLIPASSGRFYDRAAEREYLKRKKKRKQDEARAASPPSPTADKVRQRYRSLDARLARLEKHVTSRRFQLEQEFRRL